MNRPIFASRSSVVMNSNYDARHIDRLNIGAVRTNQLHWMQPHEGNIIDFLYRNRAFQNSPPPAH